MEKLTWGVTKDDTILIYDQDISILFAKGIKTVSAVTTVKLHYLGDKIVMIEIDGKELLKKVLKGDVDD